MVHVCFTVRDENALYSKFAGTAMLSLFSNTAIPSPSINVHILHDNTLTDDNRSKFSYLAGRYGVFVKFYNVEELCANKIKNISDLFTKINKADFSSGSFYKFLIPQVLPADIQKIIYLAVNTVTNLDINELWKIELGDKVLGVVPALAIGSDIHTQDKIVADGFVKADDYFSSSVMLMNLEILRKEEKTLAEGMEFVNKHGYFNLLDQTILNYCFATRTVKLPANFNQFVRLARQNKESLAKKIYNYTGYSLQMDIEDPFNRLWMEYFSKTPWFNVETIGRLYESIKYICRNLLSSSIKLSAIMSGKTRAFFTVPQNVKAIKEIFAVRDNEEIIIAENPESFQKLIYAMKLAKGKKVFFILFPDFPFKILLKENFSYGRDFMNGFEFLSEDYGAPFNSHPLIKNM